MKKKGQAIFGMSFGTIFSIIIIIAIVFVAFFAIRHFLKINKCTQIGFFYEELGDKVESVWTSGGANDIFIGTLPASGILSSKITHVCFGDLSQRTSGDAESQSVGSDLEEFYRTSDLDENVFMYPPEETCLPK
ncbi:MAG: hypothetical protein KC506_01145, partial [Nanoarchaeota archaeon]|nr:hypothetical protein [Nanoarchaeota archaeon]